MRNNSNTINFYVKEYIREKLESSLDKFGRQPCRATISYLSDVSFLLYSFKLYLHSVKKLNSLDKKDKLYYIAIIENKNQFFLQYFFII